MFHNGMISLGLVFTYCNATLLFWYFTSSIWPFVVAASEATTAALSTVSCLCVYLGLSSSFTLGAMLMGGSLRPGLGEWGVACRRASIHISRSSRDDALNRYDLRAKIYIYSNIIIGFNHPYLEMNVTSEYISVISYIPNSIKYIH